MRKLYEGEHCEYAVPQLRNGLPEEPPVIGEKGSINSSKADIHSDVFLSEQ